VFNLISDHNGPALPAGDLNISTTNILYKEMTRIFEELDLNAEDTNYMTNSTFTFQSTGNNSRSWIDHCFATKGIMKNISLPYCVSASDHLPMLI